MPSLLLIDDEPAIVRALSIGLRARGYELHTAQNGRDGLAEAALRRPDVVVLDLRLPDLDGIEVCHQLRGWSEVPILILSAHGEEDRKVAALDAGADDFITKPFGMAELEARIRAVMRHPRSEPAERSPTALTVGTLDLNLVRSEARIDGTTVSLRTKESEMLAFLARHAGKTCTHQMILGAVWGTGYGQQAQYVHAYVHRLRQKLDDSSGTLIQSISGVGYCLSVDSEFSR